MSSCQRQKYTVKKKKKKKNKLELTFVIGYFHFGEAEEPVQFQFADQMYHLTEEEN